MDIECSPRPFPENSRRWRRGLLAHANDRDRAPRRPCALRTAWSEYSYGNIPPTQMLFRVPTHNNGAMSDTAVPVALCCYKNRAILVSRCDLCKAEYACPEFKSKAAVMKFNALIPPSRLLAPLPIELSPRLCATATPG